MIMIRNQKYEIKEICIDVSCIQTKQKFFMIKRILVASVARLTSVLLASYKATDANQNSSCQK